MSDKLIAFSAAEQQQAEAIVIDSDKEEAIKFMAMLVQRFKGSSESHACGPKRTQ
jgi:hypothetical protein